MIRKEIQKIIDNIEKFKCYRRTLEFKGKDQEFQISIDYKKFLTILNVIHTGEKGDDCWRKVPLNSEEDLLFFDICHKIISKKTREYYAKEELNKKEMEIEREKRINKTIDYCLDHSDFNSEEKKKKK